MLPIGPTSPPIQWDWVTVSILVFAGISIVVMLLSSVSYHRRRRALQREQSSHGKRPSASVSIARKREGTR